MGQQYALRDATCDGSIAPIPAVRGATIEPLESSSRPEEFHLRALPEPCMTLSSHTAPDVRPLP
jgi:hypothetical protein